MKTKTAARRRLSQWQKWKKQSPRVPQITCPDIDSILDLLKEQIDSCRPYTKRRHNRVSTIMERLRRANDRLRESGQYWYTIAKHLNTHNK